MTSIGAVQSRLEQAEGLAAILDAAYAAFEELLAHLSAHEDLGGELVAPFLLGATRAANGRDAVLFAPALPARPLHRDQPIGPGERSVESVVNAAKVAAALSAVLAARLTGAACLTVGHADRAACQEASRYAQEIHDLAAGLAP